MPSTRRAMRSLSDGGTSVKVAVNRGERPLDLQVAEVGVAQLRKGPVANVQRPAAEAAPAGHGEVPGQEEVAAPDLRLASQLAEKPLVVGAAPLDRRAARPDAVAVEAEGPARPDRATVGPLEVAQGDDVALALAEVAGRPDDEHAVRLDLRVGVDLRPDGVPPAGAGVDHHHRGAPGQAPGDVAYRRQPAGAGRLHGLEAGNLGEQHRARAEPVGAVHVDGVDVHAVRVRRHGPAHQRESPAGGRGGVALGVVVVRPGIQADRRVGEVTPLRRPLPLRLGGCGHQQRHGGGRHGGPASPPHRAGSLPGDSDLRRR